MFVPALLLISYVGSLVFLFASLLYLYYLYRKGKHLGSLKSKRDTVLEEAQASAHKIIQDAIDRAREILVDTKYVREDFVKKLEDEMQAVAAQAASSIQADSRKFESEYGQFFNDIKQEFARAAREDIASLRDATQKEIEGLRAALEKETITTSEFIGKKINDTFDETVREVEVYRQKRLGELNQAVDALVLRIAEDVLGHALTLPDHEQLIQDAIERAKREGLFR